jgi:hypothetical protein
LATCLLVGALHSLIAAAALSVIAHIVRLLLLARAAKAVCGISTFEIVRSMGPTATMAVGAAAATLLGRFFAEWLQLPLLLNLGVAVASGGLACLGLAVAFKHPISAELKRLRRKPVGP